MDNIFKRWISSPVITAIGRRRMTKRFSDSPIIIGGCARTGTSLLVSIFSAHPRIFAIPTETGVFSNWKLQSGSTFGNPFYIPQRPDRIHRYVISHPIPQSITRWCEKTPSNVRHIEKILAFFNNRVKFVHIIRDARDVLTSRHPENPEKYWVSPERWINDTRAGLAFQNHPCILTIKYESLVHDHEETLRCICNFLEEPFDHSFLNWFENSSVRKNRAWFHPLKKLHKQSVEKWKKPENADRLTEIMANQEVVNLMTELGYTQN